MAIGADKSLPSAAPSPLRQKSAPRFAPAPPAISDARVSDQVNNLMAGSAGAGQSAMQEMDRAGISRGRGHQYRADMAQSAADVKSAVGAAEAEMGAADANSRARQAYDTTMRGEQLANAGLLEGLRSQGVRERIAKRGWQQDLAEAIRRGQLGLDSIYADPSQIVELLMQSR